MNSIFIYRSTIDDQEPKPGSSKENATKETLNPSGNMTLLEYLALPENKDANLVQPLEWCPHLKTIETFSFPKSVDVLKAECEECHHVGENWICLVCFSVHCSRYVNEHMLIHGTEKKHALTLSFSDISVWCYQCNDYLDNPKLFEFKNAIHRNKFGEDMPKPQSIAHGNETIQIQMQ